MFKNKKTYIFAFVVIISIAITANIIIKNSQQVEVFRTIPADKSIEISEKTQIEIFFNDNVDNKGKESISVTISPNIEYDSVWNLNVYKIIPKHNLNTAQKYEIFVTHRGKDKYKFDFTTKIINQESLIQNKKQLTEDAMFYGNALDEIIKDYPWYPNLPIKTDKYLIYYDFETEKFIITFVSKNLSQKEIDEFIKEALLKIKSVGGTEPIQYVINE